MTIDFQRLEDMATDSQLANQMLEIVYGLGCHYQRNHHSSSLNNRARERAERILNTLTNNLHRTVRLHQLTQFPVLNFSFACDGENNLPYFIKKSDFFRKLCPDLNQVNKLTKKNHPTQSSARSTSSPIRVGFISQFLSYDHSVFKDRHQIIHFLSQQSDFDVNIFTFRKPEPVCCSALPLTPFEVLPHDLEKAIKTIADANLDVLIFCDIGMFDPVYFIAHCRLAKIQINTWGHSSSSGIDTIDYFISSRYYETNNAQRFYREKLILCDSLSTCYINPRSRYNTQQTLDRKAFALPSDSTIYTCLQSTYKLSPIFLDLVRDLLEADSTAHLVFLNGEDMKAVMKRFDDFPHRITLSPQLPHKKYLELMALSDVVLDPYPVGGCNSSLEAFSLDKCVVTWPTELLNGRFTQGFYQKMGIDKPPIAHNKSEYVYWALHLGKNIHERRRLSDSIHHAKHHLFSEVDSCTEWASLLRHLFITHRNQTI